jgi:hypothetical protein
MQVFDQAPAPDYWSEAELRASAAPQAARPGRSARPALLLAAALLVILTISAAVAVGSGVVDLWPVESPIPSAAESPAPTTAGSQAPTAWIERMPGPRGGSPGEYGTTVAPGSTRGMHSVISYGSEFRQTQLIFAVEDECFGPGRDPVSVTVAGLNGLYLEPYKGPSMTFLTPRGGERTGAYALPIDGRTLCVYLTWDPATTPEELAGARQVVESIRGRLAGEHGIQINFTTTGGWDTG